MWSKYQKNLEILVKEIDSCSEEDWEDREQYWIQYYKDKGFNLMNLDKGGHGVITKEKRSKSSIQRSIEGHEIAVVALYKDGTFYKEWASSIKAAEELGIKSHSAITNVINGWSKSCCGFIFMKKSEYDPNKDYTYHDGNEKHQVAVYQFDLKGTLIRKIPKITDFNKIDGFSQNGVSAAIKNRKIYHGYYWALTDSIDINEFEQENTIRVIDLLNDESIEFRGLKEAAKYLGYKSTGTICTAIKNKSILKKQYKVEKI